MTLFTNLTNAGLPIYSATEDGNEIGWLESPTDEQMQTCRDIVLQYVDLVAYTEIIQNRVDKQQLKDEYLATITQLQNIENAVNPTSVQVIAAVKFLAKTLRLLLKLIVKIIVK